MNQEAIMLRFLLLAVLFVPTGTLNAQPRNRRRGTEGSRHPSSSDEAGDLVRSEPHSRGQTHVDVTGSE